MEFFPPSSNAWMRISLLSSYEKSSILTKDSKIQFAGLQDGHKDVGNKCLLNIRINKILELVEYE